MITRNRFLARSALVVMLSYVTVMLTCAYAEAKHLPLGAQSLEATALTSETPSRGGDKELCEFMHEQLFTKQAFAASSITVVKISYVVLIGEDMLRQIADLNGFRPPGTWFTPIEKLNFRSYSILRI